MSNVRKVTHRQRKDGTARTTWRATWRGGDGKRRSKNFPKKGEAEAHLKTVDGAETRGSATMTVEALALAHYAHFDGLVRQGVREASTRDAYGAHIDLHLKSDPEFAARKLCDLTTPACQNFLDALLPRCGSLDIVKRLRRSLVTWCKFGQRRGWLTANPAQPCSVESQARPDVGEDRLTIPEKAQLAALLASADAGDHPTRDAAVVRLLMFGGFRISELLGLPDEAVAFAGAGAMIKIRERLDRKYKVLGRVKSAKARRDVPIGPSAAHALKSWRLRRGPARAFMHTVLDGTAKRAPGRLFPNPDGGDLWGYDDFIRDCWIPLLERAGMVDRLRDSQGKVRPSIAFYPHTLRHVAASLWIEQGLQPKKVQELLGHSTLGMTMDLYGHLWRDDAQDAALAHASENLIMAATPRNA